VWAAPSAVAGIAISAAMLASVNRAFLISHPLLWLAHTLLLAGAPVEEGLARRVHARNPGMDIPSLAAPWTEIVLEQVPGIELFDAHTHLGQNDPDGMSQTPEQLLAVLEQSGARGAFVFPMHEPGGYPPANDAVLAAAADSDGLLVPFCRVNPHEDPIAEAERCLEAGARGIKLHPRAEQFTLGHPQVRSLAAIARERRLPILIHAGRGIPALGLHAVELATEFPDARLILAHAAICDLSWIWRVAPDHPNLLFDTAWWMPADLQTLFSLVPPGQILFASDAPYGHTLMSAIFQLRSALQVGLSREQIRSITSEQSLRIAAGEPLAPAGPAVGERDRASHVLLDRVAEYVMLGAIATMRGSEGGPEMLALARMACDVPDGLDDAPVFASIRSLLDAFDEISAAEPDNRRRLAFLILAASVARTPDVPVPPA
jgi:predicted TIM-barrel fold metal-dependent hydrolase